MTVSKGLNPAQSATRIRRRMRWLAGGAALASGLAGLVALEGAHLVPGAMLLLGSGVLAKSALRGLNRRRFVPFDARSALLAPHRPHVQAPSSSTKL